MAALINHSIVENHQRWLSVWIVRAILPISMICSPLNAQKTDLQLNGDKEIVVTAARTPTTPGTIDRYSSDNIRTLGAMTIGEVIARLERRNGGRPLSVLVNGRRLADISDLREVPPEALEKIEILANTSASRYGFTPQNKVLNLVLKPSFASVSGDASVRLPTEGAGQNGSIALRHVNIKKEKRINASGSYQGTRAIDGQDRKELLSADGSSNSLDLYRTLLPSNRQATITAGLALPVGSTSVGISMAVVDGLSLQLSRFFLGRRSQAGRPEMGEVTGIVDRSRTRSYRLGLNSSGIRGKMNWTANINAASSIFDTGSQISKIHVKEVLDPFTQTTLPSQFQVISTKTKSLWFDIDISANAPIASLPAGLINGNVGFSFNRQRALARPIKVDSANQWSSQDRITSNIGASIPLLASGMPKIGYIGRVDLSLNGKVERISNTNALFGGDASFQWQPMNALTLEISQSRTRTPVTIARRNEPVISTPGYLYYDTLTSQSVFVSRIMGGSRDLLGQSQSTTTMRVTYTDQLGQAKMAANFEYLLDVTSNPIIFAGNATPVFQRSFPDRFVRNKEGRLISLDARPFNAIAESRRLLRSTIHFSGGLGDSLITTSKALLWDINVSYDLTLKDDLQPSPGASNINLLKTPLDGIQGASLHMVSLASALSHGNLNLNIDAKWRSGTRVTKDPDTSSGIIMSAPFWTANAEVSWTLPQTSKSKSPFRIWLTVDNLLNHRPSVKDDLGQTPVAFRRGSFDPIGRVIGVRASRQF